MPRDHSICNEYNQECDNQESVKQNQEKIHNVFTCSICQKKYIGKKKFTAHMAMHVEVEEDKEMHNWTVSISRKTIELTKDQLVQLSIELRPRYICTCKKQFTQKSNLIAHERTHNSKICNKKFKRKSELSRHT